MIENTEVATPEKLMALKDLGDLSEENTGAVIELIGQSITSSERR